MLKRPPDFVIVVGDVVTLRRWYLLPRNRFLSLYLHHQMADDDVCLHDHRSWNISIILKGGYWEVMPLYRPLYPEMALDVFLPPFRWKWRRPGFIIFRRAADAHRLEVGRRPSWSLFITGPSQRVWGFWTRDGWVRHSDYAKIDKGVSRKV